MSGQDAGKCDNLTLSGQRGADNDTEGTKMSDNEKTQKCWDCNGYREPGKACECQGQAPERTQLDKLFTELREALNAQREAGYQSGRYTAGAGTTADQSLKMLDANAKADDLVAALWGKLYDLAPAFSDALDVLDAVKGLEVRA